jgi:methionyl-tRNA formyltransferase
MKIAFMGTPNFAVSALEKLHHTFTVEYSFYSTTQKVKSWNERNFKSNTPAIQSTKY